MIPGTSGLLPGDRFTLAAHAVDLLFAALIDVNWRGLFTQCSSERLCDAPRPRRHRRLAAQLGAHGQKRREARNERREHGDGAGPHGEMREQRCSMDSWREALAPSRGIGRADGVERTPLPGVGGAADEQAREKPTRLHRHADAESRRNKPQTFDSSSRRGSFAPRLHRRRPEGSVRSR